MKHVLASLLIPLWLLAVTALAHAKDKIEDLEFTPPAPIALLAPIAPAGVAAPTIVTETLSLLTEIARERAKAGALRVIKKRFVAPFCTDKGTKITLKQLGLVGEELAVPRSCALLDGLRLEDILSSGRALLNAIRDDLRYTIAPAAIAKIGIGDDGKNMLKRILEVMNADIDSGRMDVLEAQLLLEELGNFELAPTLLKLATRIEKARPASPKVIEDKVEAAPLTTLALLQKSCLSRLAVAVIKDCNSTPCSGTEISDRLSDPSGAYDVDTKILGLMCWNTGTFITDAGTQISTKLVNDGLKLLEPGQDHSRAKAAVRLLLEVVKQVPVATGALNDPFPKLQRQLDAFGETAIAFLDEDYGTALTRALAILDEELKDGQPKALRPMTKIFGAVAAYAAVYRATKDEDPKQAHEARKKALESVIDGATDRTQRESEWIVSLGSNVGLSASVNYPHFDKSFADRITPGVRLPLAVRWERLSKHDGWRGFHGAIQLIDLGQFVHSDEDDDLGEVRWADFVSPGIEAGYSLGGLLTDRALNISVHASYAPSLLGEKSDDLDMTRKSGVWRVGVALSYYVPFFDFN